MLLMVTARRRPRSPSRAAKRRHCLFAMIIRRTET
jgi:hypothetical protein